MRKYLLMLVTLEACLLVGHGPAMGGIAGSAHDFSDQGWSQGNVCRPCHTPHGADTTISGAPLWNHEVTVATYTLYSSDSMDATVEQPSGWSKLCLSCHDGTVAMDSFGGATGSTMMSGGALVGTDLKGTHPISFVYDTALAVADGELHDPMTSASNLGGSIDADLLIDRKVECASCHNVHGAQDNPQLLRVNNSGSALCLTCHDK